MDALDVPVSRDHSINAPARLTLTYALRHSTRYDTHHRASHPPTVHRSPPISSPPFLFPSFPGESIECEREKECYSPVSKTV